MFDVIASRLKGVPSVRDIAAQVMPFLRTAFGIPSVRVGAAVAASAVAAAVICLLFPSGSPAPALKSRQATFAAHSTVAGFDVAARWQEEQAQLSDMTGRGLAAGDLSTLLTARVPPAGLERSAEAAVPLPPPAPRAGRITRPNAAPGKPVAIEPQLASLPPQTQQKPGTFNFFGKLFADPDKAAKDLLAANPKTALYDITKRVVYLPDGDKLEAHSGFGKSMDDPASVKIKDRGVTPPNVYAVSFREKPFHGVRALRLKPVGGGDMYGRDGILAHSYLLGEQGASNGCVSVRDYDKFLQAYEDGEFDRIIVVRSADEPGPALAATAAPGGA